HRRVCLLAGIHCRIAPGRSAVRKTASEIVRDQYVRTVDLDHSHGGGTGRLAVRCLPIKCVSPKAAFRGTRGHPNETCVVALCGRAPAMQSQAAPQTNARKTTTPEGLLCWSPVALGHKTFKPSP